MVKVKVALEQAMKAQGGVGI